MDSPLEQEPVAYMEIIFKIFWVSKNDNVEPRSSEFKSKTFALFLYNPICEVNTLGNWAYIWLLISKLQAPVSCESLTLSSPTYIIIRFYTLAYLHEIKSYDNFVVCKVFNFGPK